MLSNEEEHFLIKSQSYKAVLEYFLLWLLRWFDLQKNELDYFESNFLSSDICFGPHLLSFLQKLSKDREGRIFPIKCFYKEANDLKRNTSFSLRCCRLFVLSPSHLATSSLSDQCFKRHIFPILLQGQKALKKYFNFNSTFISLYSARHVFSNNADDPGVQCFEEECDQ